VTMRRKKIEPDTAVPVTLTLRDKELIEDHTFTDTEYVKRLKPGGRGKLRGNFTLEDLDDLTGYVAAEANHSKDKELKKELDGLWERLTKVMESYDDGG